jgi:hypothetical protein
MMSLPSGYVALLRYINKRHGAYRYQAICWYLGQMHGNAYEVDARRNVVGDKAGTAHVHRRAASKHRVPNWSYRPSAMVRIGQEPGLSCGILVLIKIALFRHARTLFSCSRLIRALLACLRHDRTDRSAQSCYQQLQTLL